MQKNEKVAGGMSYRTMDGINFKQISKYLEGYNDISSQEILEKNKKYYIASANKTIARIILAKKRAEYGLNSSEHVKLINTNISASLKWLQEIKKIIKKTNTFSEFLDEKQYKKWHAVKLLPASVEGIIIASNIKVKLLNIDFNYNKSDNQIVVNIKKHIEKAETIFLKLLNLNERSDFKNAEIYRIEAYNELVQADEKFESLKNL